ncbi:MAG: glycosyltransferase family 4 protein [Solirubrobacterales bacterium]|nr:glycosyltransferase family 4 protein [Solirubrobacterales bacterium]
MTDAHAELRRRFPRVAVTHEWLTIPGGSEQVVAQVLELFPDAELFTSIYDPEPWAPPIAGRRVHASFLDRLPGARRHYPKLLPLMNLAFESFDLSGFDLVISSNHACAKNVVVAPGARHVCYCHTPMRYAWDPRFLAEEDLGRAAALAARALLPRLRRQDFLAAQRPDAILANSTTVAERVARHWRREAEVLHPPVDVDRFLTLPRAPSDYYLVLGRVVPYKRVDLALGACARLGRRVKVAGDGRALETARVLAGPEAELLGRVPDADQPGLLAGARALLFCAEEDFGMVPVEAMAAGVPVIAYGVGGARDSVLDGETGILFDDQTEDSLMDAIERFEALSFDEDHLREHARAFGPERFRAELAEHVLALDPEAVLA